MNFCLFSHTVVKVPVFIWAVIYTVFDSMLEKTGPWKNVKESVLISVHQNIFH